MLTFEQAVTNAASMLSQTLAEPGAHVFFDDWDVKFFEEPPFNGTVPSCGDPQWIEIGRRAASVLSKLEDRFAIHIPLVSLDSPPTGSLRLGQLTSLEDWTWAYPSIYFLGNGSAFTARNGEDGDPSSGMRWFPDDVPQLDGVHVWLQAERDDEPLPEEPAAAMYRLSLYFETTIPPVR